MKKLAILYFVLGICCLAFANCSTSSPVESEESQESAVGANMMFSQVSMDTNAVEGALPFTMEFVEQNYSGKAPLPRLQSFASAMNEAGEIFIAGGRRQGLHTFNPAPDNNFVKDSANNFLFIIDPTTGDQWSFDVNQLSSDFSAPLQATNLQSYHDRDSDNMYIVGGYGWKADGTNMVTFGSVIRFKLEQMTQAIKNGSSATEVQALMKIGLDDRLAVTGGELFYKDLNFYLVFGQRFDGQYRAFGGNDFTQEYTEEIRTFRLNQNLQIGATYGASKNSGIDHPFHRRDGNIIESIDPKTGNPIFTALGGVFKRGIIGGYDYPIYIENNSSVSMDSTVHQRFSQYECPIITVYHISEQDTSVYHTMFGGISLYYYFQTPQQHADFVKVDGEGRNDGLPFISDISTFQNSSNGSYQEFILPQPITGNRLLGSSTSFINNRGLSGQGVAFDNGVVQLNNIPPGGKVLAGYIFGGIEAAAPLPLIPNHGTSVSNSLFAVYVYNNSSAAIPAELAIKARPGAPMTELPH